MYIKKNKQIICYLNHTRTNIDKMTGISFISLRYLPVFDTYLNKYLLIYFILYLDE